MRAVVIVATLLGLVGFSAPARAGMVMPSPLSTRIQQADAVILGVVTGVDVDETEEVRTVSMTVDVVDSLPSRSLTGAVRVRVIQRGLGTSADFGTRYAVFETRLFVLQRSADGVLEQQLFVAPTLSSVTPAHPHPLARGGRWLVLPDWGYGGVQFPLGLPLTFASEAGDRRCHDDELNTFVAWFTWEDLQAVPWDGVDATRVQVVPDLPCDHREPFAVAVRCTPERCAPTWWHHEAITCRGPAGVVTLTRDGPDTFVLRGAMKKRRLPRRVRAVVDEPEEAVRLVALNGGGRDVLRLHQPWYDVVAVVSPTGGTPPPVPSLHVQASLMGRRHPEDTQSLICTAP